MNRENWGADSDDSWGETPQQVKVQILNCTPHSITVAGHTFLPAGVCPRVAITRRELEPIMGIPVVQSQSGEVSGLPRQKAATYLVVSRQVAESAPERRDLLVVDGAIRDAEGKIVGAERFAQIAYIPRPTEAEIGEWIATSASKAACIALGDPYMVPRDQRDAAFERLVSVSTAAKAAVVASFPRASGALAAYAKHSEETE